VAARTRRNAIKDQRDNPTDAAGTDNVVPAAAPFDDALWDRVVTIAEQFRGQGILIAANLVGGALTVVQLVGGGLSERSGHDAAVMVVVAATTALIVFGVIQARVHRRVKRMVGWVRERRPPTDPELQLVLRFAWSTVIDVFVGWSVASVVLAGVGAVLDYPVATVVRIGVIGAVAGLTATALSYLLLEQVVRPALQLALAGAVAPADSGPGLLGRLLLGWVLTGAVPVTLLGTAWVGQTGSQRANLPLALAVIGAVSLVWGTAITHAIARSLIEPVTILRTAQRRVQDGDLSLRIPVDYSGEIGQLQTGFNAMTEGLRERERLRDLFGRHVGAEVVRNALTAGVRLGGERRSASVLFIDLINSTAMTQHLAPDAVVAWLNEVFAAVVRCAAQQGGWVNKFEGDAALCVFGPPGENPGHAEAALCAARALRAELISLAQRYPDLDAGIGVSSGQVVAGNIGARDRYEYTVIGNPVNEAARLTEQAKAVPERVLASRSTVVDAADEGCRWRPYRQMRLRGLSSPTDTYVPIPVSARQ
jgi:adenylate cyclase